MKDKYILHIPHSSINIPDHSHYNLNLLEDEIIKLTDWCTDMIFDINGVDKIVTPFNRVFCDVERYSDDDKEVMSKFGRGFFYTKTDSGLHLRDDNPTYKDSVKKYYDVHHVKLLNLVNDKLKNNDEVIIIDAHSFSDVPFNSDLIKDEIRPDICIGSDDTHTPKYLLDSIVNYFESNNLTVEVNSPYSGTIVPLDLYGDIRVKSIMIEVNRKLYMDDSETINIRKVIKLNQLMNNMI